MANLRNTDAYFSVIKLVESIIHNNYEVVVLFTNLTNYLLRIVLPCVNKSKK